ncbi:MAG TPA: DinB family protein [Acidimicrobiia bacterium]|jgi:uncharacterized damage-inducible protein DinB|nr:DinB family protein [Acidimicrobiia bacterium]
MPGTPPPVTDERDNLLTWLDQQRTMLKVTAYGLTDEQARTPAPPTELTVGGLIKHVAQVEDYWIKIVLQETTGGNDEYEGGLTMRADETLASIIEYYDDVAAHTDKVVAGIADLGQAVPVPRDAPWFPPDIDAWSVRWVLLHIIQETSRHAGHADLIRERVDGATAFPLLAAAEGWPETEWLKPWSPAAGA